MEPPGHRPRGGGARAVPVQPREQRHGEPQGAVHGARADAARLPRGAPGGLRVARSHVPGAEPLGSERQERGLRPERGVLAPRRGVREASHRQGAIPRRAPGVREQLQLRRRGWGWSRGWWTPSDQRGGPARHAVGGEDVQGGSGALLRDPPDEPAAHHHPVAAAGGARGEADGGGVAPAARRGGVRRRDAGADTHRGGTGNERARRRGRRRARVGARGAAERV